MNRLVVILGVLAAILLLSPYLGINIFGRSYNADEGAPPARVETAPPAPQKQRPAGERPKGKQTMVEDILAPAPQAQTDDPKKLSDIENLLNSDGENK